MEDTFGGSFWQDCTGESPNFNTHDNKKSAVQPHKTPATMTEPTQMISFTTSSMLSSLKRQPIAMASSQKCSGKCKKTCFPPGRPKIDETLTRPNPPDFSEGHEHEASDTSQIPRTEENMEVLRCALVRRQMVDIM
jgi:hypothetical protein